MADFDASAPAVLFALATHYGRPAPEFPSRIGSFSTVVRAFLASRTEARKVDAILSALVVADLLDPQTLIRGDVSAVLAILEEYRIPRSPVALGLLVRLAKWWVERVGESNEILDAIPTAQIREEWLGINGIGPATADMLLLIGLGRAAYPVDRPSFRVAARHGWVEAETDYEEARSVLERLGEDEPLGVLRLSTWMSRIGRDFCKPARPRCDRCPLRSFLPDGGPVANELGD